MTITSESTDHFETFSLVWLDNNESTYDLCHIEQELRAIINNLKRFQNVQGCRKYIQEQSQIYRIIMIDKKRINRSIKKVRSPSNRY